LRGGIRGGMLAALSRNGLKVSGVCPVPDIPRGRVGARLRFATHGLVLEAL
jgi:hypothetical protein